MTNNMTRGLTLQEMVKSSLRAAKSYSRSSTDSGAQRDYIHRRMSVETWDLLGKWLLTCMEKISENSKGWTDTDPLRDFASNAWTTLEQQGDTAFAATEVVIVEDLTSKDQMHAARAALQIAADNTADHLRLFIKLNEQHHTQEVKLAQWNTANGTHTWFVLDN